MSQRGYAASMKILVEVYGALRMRLKASEGPIALELPEGSTVGLVVKELGVTENEAWNASLRGKLASSKDVLRDGDHLLVFDAIGGG